MFLKLRYIFPLIITICLNTSHVSVNNNPIRTSAHESKGDYNIKDYKLLSSIPEENIHLYAIDWKEEEIKHRGVYREILLDLKGKLHYFPWTVDSGEAFKPRLILSDINNDGVRELIVITTTGTGTGIFIQEVHIFNVDTFTDINVMHPIEVMYQNVKTKITKNKDIINITINIKDNIFITTAKESSAGIWSDDVGFGGRIEYDVVDNKLIAKVGAQVSLSLYVGQIKIQYIFKNKRMEPNNITFEKFQGSNIFSKGY